MDGNIIGNLIEFALQNVWVVVIVIGFLYNVFRRFNGNVTEPTTPVPIPDPFKQFHQDDRTEDIPPAQNYEEFSVDPVEEEPVTERTNNIYEQYLQSQERKKQADITPSAIQVKSPERIVQNKVSKNKVVEGVIWSEILGPPRAKRPYSRRNIH